MDIIHNGDSVVNTVPTTKQKALKINLNKNIYGSFAEIGAGQETVRQFFRAGGASSTIAKSMSAYDKDFSDAIYGIENDKRYVQDFKDGVDTIIGMLKKTFSSSLKVTDMIN